MSTIQKIVGLLQDERLERRCAAAMVLGALGERDSAVIKALGHTLREDNRVLRLYCLEALEVLGASGVTEQVLPLLDSPDEEVRRRAQRVLEAQGARAAPVVARDLASAPLAHRRTLVAVLAKIWTRDTLDTLLATLRDPDVAEHTLSAMRAELDHGQASQRAVVARKLHGWIGGKAVKADPFATANALRMLGYVGEASSLPTLVRFLAPKIPPLVRAAAAAALRRPLGSARRGDAVLARLIDLSDDADAQVARASVDTLRNVELPPRLAGPLIKLSDSRHAETRAFVAERLGAMNTEPASRKLLETVLGGEPAAREAAARSLSRLPSAVKPLLETLGKDDDPAHVNTAARILRAHSERIAPAARRALADRAVRWLEKSADDPRAVSLLELLGQVDSKLRDATLLARGVKLKKSGRFADAWACLRPLARSEALDNEARLTLATVGLAQGSRDLARAARSTDPTLSQFTALLSSGFPVAARLKKDKQLSPEDLYYLGFNFVESPEEDEKEFGAELLSHLAHKSPGSKIGKSAKNKLRLAGLDEAA